MALEEPEIGSTDPNILRDNNCTNDKLHFGIPVCSEDYDHKCDEIDESDAIPTARRGLCGTTQLGRFNLGTSDVDGYEGDDGNNADADEEAEPSQDDDGLTQTLED